MKHSACIAMLLSLLIAMTAPAALAREQAENQTIDVIGTGRIYGEDISGARNQAIANSLVTAISLVASDLLQQQVFIQSFQDINRLLLSQADEFVQDYKVLTEDASGRIYRVMVQTTVSVQKIRELLIQNDILSQNASPLKVLLLIAEQDLDGLFYRYWWDDANSETVSEASLTDALAEQGFVVVDHRPSWSVADDFDTMMETPLGPEMSGSPADASIEREGVPLDRNPLWPPAGNGSDTILEIPLGPEMSGTRADASIEREEVPLDRNPLWPSAGDGSDTILETPLGPEMSLFQTGALVKREFMALDRRQLWPAGDGTLLETPPGPEMSNDQAAALGARFQADVVIVGSTAVKKASNVLGDELRSFEGALSVRAVRVDTGAVLAEISHKFITADADDFLGSRRALTKTGAQAGELLAWKIQTAWQQMSQKGPAAATIVVEGGFQLPHLVAFRRILSGMPGVSNLQTTEMTPRGTTLSLEYEGTTKELAEALLLNSFEGFGVHIAEAAPETIRLSLVSN